VLREGAVPSDRQERLYQFPLIIAQFTSPHLSVYQPGVTLGSESDRIDHDPRQALVPVRNGEGPRPTGSRAGFHGRRAEGIPCHRRPGSGPWSLPGRLAAAQAGCREVIRSANGKGGWS
jgi:hypothetical protein